jgi:RIO-like serine/threonine protein kinase
MFDQILAYLEKIYKGFYIHGDINTENIYVGLGKIGYQFGLIGFSHAKPYNLPQS